MKYVPPWLQGGIESGGRLMSRYREFFTAYKSFNRNGAGDGPAHLQILKKTAKSSRQPVDSGRTGCQNTNPAATPTYRHGSCKHTVRRRSTWWQCARAS